MRKGAGLRGAEAGSLAFAEALAVSTGDKATDRAEEEAREEEEETDTGDKSLISRAFAWLTAMVDRPTF